MSEVKKAYMAQGLPPIKEFAQNIFKGEFSNVEMTPTRRDIWETATVNAFNCWHGDPLHNSGDIWADITNFLYEHMESARKAIDQYNSNGMIDTTRPIANTTAGTFLSLLVSEENLNDPHCYVNQAGGWGNRGWLKDDSRFGGRDIRDTGICLTINGTTDNEDMLILTYEEIHYLRTGKNHPYKNIIGNECLQGFGFDH